MIGVADDWHGGIEKESWSKWWAKLWSFQC